MNWTQVIHCDNEKEKIQVKLFQQAKLTDQTV